MQDIVVHRPYQFVPPHTGDWWPWFIQKFNLVSIWLRRSEGVVAHEVRGLERLRASLDAGHGVMLAPNHCRYADPLVMGYLARRARTHVYAMASWHLFNQGWFYGFAIQKMGGFSVFREGVDKQAINTAIEILEKARRPLIVFPEGSVSRTNDRLHALLDGVSFIARTAGKRRAKQDAAGKVVIHPVGIKYYFQGDLDAAVGPVLEMIEERLSWRPQTDVPLLERVFKIGHALLCLKELQYFGRPQEGTMAERLTNLINGLLHPIETEWLGAPQEGPIVPRVKNLRTKIMPEMVRGEIDEAEFQRRWLQLSDMYLAQQVRCYPPDYLTSRPTVDRILETVERFEEDLTGKVRVHGALKAVMQVGEAIEVSPERDRRAEVDPVMAELSARLQAILDELALESRLYAEE
ncbi:MAG: 1-acyl-sn-glycerol-3-phosphate acyltransferase [Planctomycetes bacterium]|nr:1-acyl-sn-glycerol-3-phosphate acyltransferase [Planctomycetota bacterium]